MTIMIQFMNPEINKIPGQSACHERNGLIQGRPAQQTRRPPAAAMGKIRLRRPRPARPLGRPGPPRAPPAPINTRPTRASPHSSLAIRAQRTSRARQLHHPVFVFSVIHNESDNSSVRDRRFGSRHRQRSGAAAPRRGERRDPDVPVQVTGPGAVHAQEPEDLQTGGDPARDRLHLRPAVGAGEPPRHGTVRRGRRTGVAAVRRGAAAAPRAPPARAPRGAQHHPPQNHLQTRTAQNPHDT